MTKPRGILRRGKAYEFRANCVFPTQEWSRVVQGGKRSPRGKRRKVKLGPAIAIKEEKRRRGEKGGGMNKEKKRAGTHLDQALSMGLTRNSMQMGG